MQINVLLTAFTHISDKTYQNAGVMFRGFITTKLSMEVCIALNNFVRTNTNHELCFFENYPPKNKSCGG